MSARDHFYFFAGALVMLCVLLVLRPLVARGPQGEWAPLRTLFYGAAGAASLAAAALGLYLWRGAPQLLDAQGTAARPPHADGPSRAPGPMQADTARLAARLERDGGTAADWQLLAKSYEFLGRTAEARRASARAAESSGAGDSSVELPGAAGAPVPDAAATAQLARAGELRRGHDNAGARAIYAQLAARGQLNAEGWADYADVTAALNGRSLSGEPARYIDAALRLDPRHAKALWLKASLAYEEHRYADALEGWRRLQTVLPEDSPDQRIVAANIDEAARLAGSTAAAVAARITGTVELAAALAFRAPTGATLFIYARAPEGAGPPLAVLRVRAEHWPVSFVLDDSQAMIPGRALSGASSVRVEARISRSGNALPQAGDLIGAVSNVDPHAERSVRIAIDHEIG